MEGKTLKTWIVGKKLGAGACATVYSVSPSSPISNSPVSEYVMKLVSLPPNKKGKKNKEQDRLANLLYAENLVYNQLHKQPGFPYVPLRAYGEADGCRYLVLQRLGRNLEEVLRQEGCITSQAAARLGLELIQPIRTMHAKNILYVDVKPENFMLSVDETKAYCVDFGICDRYISAVTRKHKQESIGAINGTPTFLSLSCHEGKCPSRRDDIEALLNVLIYLMRGSLPWQNAPSDEEGAALKRGIPIAQLCESMPDDWTLMLSNIRECEFADEPDYELFINRFKALGGDDHAEVYQWN